MQKDKPARASVPYAVTDPTRIPAPRYYDPAFYELEARQFWPRVWQMACRLEEIQKPGDFVEYTILDQSVIVVRVDESRVKAYHNACRHRGMKLVEDRGNARQGISCPFHGWRYSIEGNNSFLYQPDLFNAEDRNPDDLRLRECRVELWGGCAFINLDDAAPPLRESLEPFASYHSARSAENMRTLWWKSTVLPVNWKLAMEGFMEGYHVMRTHPQLLPPSANRGPDAVYRPVGSRREGSSTQNLMQRNAGSDAEVIENFIRYLKLRSEGMGGMVLDKDIRAAEGLRGIKLPADPAEAFKEWNRRLNDAITAEHHRDGIALPDLNELAKSTTTSVQYCFPNFFLLPVYGNMASYRIRPLGPESTLFEIWSLTQFPKGQEPAPPKTPIPMAADDPGWPPIPRQDFANLPRQQQGLRTRGFEYLRLSAEVEGLISHYNQVLDAYLAGVDSTKLVPALQQVSGPIDAALRPLAIEY